MGSSIVKITILLFVLSIAKFGNTQNVFNEAFDEGNAANHTANVLEYSNQYYFTQKSFILGNAVLEALILDTMGQVLQKKPLVLDSNFNIFYGYAGSFQRLTNNEFCQQYHIALDSTINLVFFDDSLNVIRNTHYDFGNYVNAGVLKQINDSTLLTLGRMKNSTKYNLFLINTDLQGNERWRTIFGEPNKNDYGYSIEFINNELIVGGQTYDNSTTAHPHLFKFNIQGNLIFDTTYNVYSNGGFLAYHDNYGLFLSASVATPGGRNPAIVKLNQNLSVNWSKEYFKGNSMVFWEQIIITGDGLLAITGVEIVNNVMTGFFFQTNHNGDSITTKLIDHITGERAQFHDIRPTSDGGYIMAGEAHTPTQDSWVVKVNSYGCDNIPCIVSVPDQPEKTEGVFNCYPNPNNGLGTVKGYIKNVNAQPSEVKVFNNLGQLIKTIPITQEHFELEIDLPKSGLYLVNLYQGNVLVESKKWVVE